MDLVFNYCNLPLSPPNISPKKLSLPKFFPLNEIFFYLILPSFQKLKSPCPSFSSAEILRFIAARFASVRGIRKLRGGVRVSISVFCSLGLAFLRAVELKTRKKQDCKLFGEMAQCLGIRPPLGHHLKSVSVTVHSNKPSKIFKLSVRNCSLAPENTRKLVAEVKEKLEKEHNTLPMGKNGRDDEEMILWFLKDRKFSVEDVVSKLTKAIS